MKANPLLLLVLAAACSSTVRAEVLTLGADRDTALIQNHPDRSLGGGPAFFAGTNGANSVRRALLSFDLSSIPAGSTITGVQLTLTLAQVTMTSLGTATIGLFGLTQNWGEGTAGNTATSVGGTGNGFTASAGDATWSAAATPGTLWTSPGGDHAATASASLLLNGTTVGSAYTWLSTPQLVADVQGWLLSPATNFGWELINANETTANSLYGFYSSEWDTFAGGNASQEPSLRVTYTVPEPGAGALLAGAALVCAVWRRWPGHPA